MTPPIFSWDSLNAKTDLKDDRSFNQWVDPLSKQHFEVWGDSKLVDPNKKLFQVARPVGLWLDDNYFEKLAACYEAANLAHEAAAKAERADRKIKKKEAKKKKRHTLENPSPSPSPPAILRRGRRKKRKHRYRSRSRSGSSDSNNEKSKRRKMRNKLVENLADELGIVAHKKALRAFLKESGKKKTFYDWTQDEGLQKWVDKLKNPESADEDEKDESTEKGHINVDALNKLKAKLIKAKSRNKSKAIEKYKKKIKNLEAKLKKAGKDKKESKEEEKQEK